VNLPLNYLEAEGFIIKALKDGLMQPGAGFVKAVLGMHDLEKVKEHSQTTPAVHVIYAGESPVSDGNGHVVSDEHRFEFTQKWLVVVCVRNAETQAALATPKNTDAGPIISKVLGLLHGKQPGKMHTPLKRGSAPAPFFDASFAYYPLLFTTDITGCVDDKY
jgi:phage gp37-like protein